MLELAVSFLIMINPFAQVLYLKSVIDDLDLKTFSLIYAKASIISLVIYVIFALIGDEIFTQFFKIRFESFKIFGGIIIFAYAFSFIMYGAKSMIQTKENLDDLASEIALPFMVGSGTLYLSILIGRSASSFGVILGTIFSIILLNYSLVWLFVFIKDQFRRRQQIAFDKYMGIFMRLNGFFMGAIGIHMILDGILYFFK
jgi:multiple antibiotic resistance protein